MLILKPATVEGKEVLASDEAQVYARDRQKSKRTSMRGKAKYWLAAKATLVHANGRR